MFRSNTALLIPIILLLLVGSCRSQKTESKQAISDNAATQESIAPPQEPPAPPGGVPAYPDTIYFQMPDNYILEIFLRGDEWNHYAKTVDGFRILLNEDGYYEYAFWQNNEYVLSGITARNERDRLDEETQLLNAISKP